VQKNIKTTIKPAILNNPANQKVFFKQRMDITRTVGQLTNSRRKIMEVVSLFLLRSIQVAFNPD
jgi:hypothetical protein